MHPLDRVFWKPGWEEVSKEEFDRAHAEIVARDRWIIDGGYSRTAEVRLKRADMVIFLDFSRLICISRVFKRNFMYRNKTRPCITPGCDEKIDWEFLMWIWHYPKRSKLKMLGILAQLPKTTQVIYIKKSNEIPLLLQNLANHASSVSNANQ
ncbi:MAG: topology modulation protein [Promethearchaeota archaeon]